MDVGGEYESNEFKAFCREHGIVQQGSEPDEPYQNGVAERANLTMANAATAMLHQAKLPLSFWRCATACYLHAHNRSPTSALSGKIPITVFKKKIPDVSYFCVFGCLAYVLIRKKKRIGALAKHSVKAIFVGYAAGVKAWEFWDPVGRKFIISSHATFDERYFPGNSPLAIGLLGEPLGLESVRFPGSDTDEDVINPGGDNKTLGNDDPTPPSVPYHDDDAPPAVELPVELQAPKPAPAPVLPARAVEPPVERPAPVPAPVVPDVIPAIPEWRRRTPSPPAVARTNPSPCPLNTRLGAFCAFCLAAS